MQFDPRTDPALSNGDALQKKMGRWHVLMGKGRNGAAVEPLVSEKNADDTTKLLTKPGGASDATCGCTYKLATMDYWRDARKYVQTSASSR